MIFSTLQTSSKFSRDQVRAKRKILKKMILLVSTRSLLQNLRELTVLEKSNTTKSKVKKMMTQVNKLLLDQETTLWMPKLLRSWRVEMLWSIMISWMTASSISSSFKFSLSKLNSEFKVWKKESTCREIQKTGLNSFIFHDNNLKLVIFNVIENLKLTFF